MYEEHRKGFIEELQALDEPMKKKILVVATAIIMVIVVYFWLAYFNNLMVGASQTATIAQDQTAQPIAGTQPTQGGQAAEPSMWANLWGNVAGALHRLGNILQAPRQYIIQPPQ
jgi:hypothetical protein